MVSNIDDKINNTVTQLHNHPIYIETIADSGCTGHYLKHDKINTTLPNTYPNAKLTVQVSNGQIMTSTHKTNLNIPSLNQKANEAHIFDELSTENLLSIGTLCDDGCKVLLDKHTINVSKDSTIILKGKRDYSTGMWNIRIPLIPANNTTKVTFKHQANFILPHKPISDCIKFMHAACFTPCISTWTKAIDKGFFSTWPVLTSTRVRRFLKHTPATDMGHLSQERQNLRSTKTIIVPRKHSDKTNSELYIHLTSPKPTSKTYSDLTGRFPTKSNRGNQYIMVVYETTSNHIFAKAMQDRSSTQMISAYERIKQSSKK